MKKIILFGGTFDPIHIGHLILAEYAKEFINAEKVIFIPSYKPPHKLNYTPTNWKHRYNMVKLAIKNCKQFEISDFEIKRKDVSYTYIAVDWFKKQYKDYDLYFLIGLDSLISLPTWEKWQDIVRKIKFLVGNRVTKHNLLSSLPKEVVKKIIFFDSPIIEISSSEIRKRVKNFLSIKYLVLEKVEEYIKKHRLYE
jgi:nicotinate-nucleotide adenylyltransferase